MSNLNPYIPNIPPPAQGKIEGLPWYSALSQLVQTVGLLVKNTNAGTTLTQWTVADLPSGSEGAVAYATNGRKVGEGAGAGTGVPVYYSNGVWRVYSTDAAVAS